jgi:Carbon starvation protein, predicted membrane protein
MTGKHTRYLATLASLALPAVFVLINFKDPRGNVLPAWKIIWPVFGATNQLLAGLALMVVAVWLKKQSKPIWFVVVPMMFMLAMTLWSLVLLIIQYQLSLIGVIGAVLLFLAILLVVEALTILEVRTHAAG